MAAASNHNVLTPRVIDTGGYGQIIYPALPNRNQSGNPIEFPGHITKRFFRKSNYRSIRERENKIREITGNASVMEPYQYQYYGKNLSPELQNSLGVHPDRPLYLLHQPHAGYSVGYMCTTEGQQRFSQAISSCSPSTILESVKQLLRQTASMANHEYIHGDIRPRNVLFDPKECRFTLIDFDMFDTYDNFYEEFMKGHGEYFSVPEALVIEAFENGIVDAYNTEPVQIDPLRFEQYCDSLYNDYRHYWNTVGIQSVDIMSTRALDAIDVNTAYLRKAMREGRTITSEIIKEIDNHAIALTMLEFFSCFPLPATEEVAELMSLLQEMADLEMSKRPSAQDAYNSVQAMNRLQGGSRRQRHLRSMRRVRRVRGIQHVRKVQRTRRISFRRKQ